VLEGLDARTDIRAHIFENIEDHSCFIEKNCSRTEHVRSQNVFGNDESETMR
jgi:hypothetical protein